jgi:RND family efflux transporter MFP subunit
MNMKRLAALALFTLASHAAQAGQVTVTEQPQLKAVFAQVQSREVIAARARLGGTIVSLAVEEGSAVKAGDVLAVVVDDKLALQLGAVDAKSKALQAELDNAKTELARATKLVKTGVAPKNRVDQFQTQVDVLTNQIVAVASERQVLEQQQTEGNVLAPAGGRVLSVPVTKGSVVMPGEPIARIASSGYFLRLSMPERHAAHIKLGDPVLVGERGLQELTDKASVTQGKVVKVYPEIESGLVQADVEVENLGDFFVGERTRAWIPVATRSVLSVPITAVSNRYGVDYVRVKTAGSDIDVPVVTGSAQDVNGAQEIEILSGLNAGDEIVTP